MTLYPVGSATLAASACKHRSQVSVRECTSISALCFFCREADYPPLLYIPHRMGDAAHPFLPTSQQGASQAVEDGVTIAHTLTLAKQRGHPLGHALKAYEALRSERVRRAQQVGVDNRNMWHKVND